MGTALRFAGGVLASLASLLAAKYLEYQGLYAPYLSIAALVVVAIIPGMIAGSFMLAFASAASGGLVGAVLWLLLLYPPQVAFPPILEAVGLGPPLGFLAVLVLAFIAAGAVGIAFSGVRGPAEEAAVLEEVQPEEVSEAQERRPVEAEEPGEDILRGILGEERPAERPAGRGEEIFLICKYCSEPVPEGALFCPYCGRRQR